MVAQARSEVALTATGSVTPVLSRLPGLVVERATASILGADVQASNVPGLSGDRYLTGSRIVKQLGIGPLPGVAMMVILLTNSGHCTVTVHYDPAAVTDGAGFRECLREGFEEVLALAPRAASEPSGRSTKARKAGVA